MCRTWTSSFPRRPHDAHAGYTEDALVEQPAIALLDELGWETVNAYHEFDQRQRVTWAARPQAEVILTPACARPGAAQP